MNMLQIIEAFSVVLLLALFSLALLHKGKGDTTEDLEAGLHNVDMQAFLNLVDPAEELYLRRNLSLWEFKSLQRQRILVMWEYLSRLAVNAKLMMRAGQMVQHSGDVESFATATQFVSNASRLRMLIFAAHGYLAVRFLFPMKRNPIAAIADRYDVLATSFRGEWARSSEQHVVVN